jgi:flagellar biogenesis protein FliO
MFGMMQTGSNTQHIWEVAAGLGAGLLAITGIVVYLVRRFFQSAREEQKKERSTGTPGTENASAFMASRRKSWSACTKLKKSAPSKRSG